MTTTNLNVSPYYDDYSNTNYNQILFKPGYSVQARELTQIQSILKDQIAKFGGHIFKHGSVVIPGNSNSDLNLCYVKLVSTTVDVAALAGKIVTGSTTGLRASVKKGLPATLTSPATLYVAYYNTGTSGERVFTQNEVLSIDGGGSITTASASATGVASMAFITAGVFFVNGSFVSVASQSVVLSNDNVPSCHVLLKITESIVSSDEDVSLLDPAQGSNNFAAPGADRLKLSLTLVTLPLSTVLSNDYVEIMRFNEGVLEEHLRYPKYNELEKSLARRTYDESGDYVVNGLTVSAREHLKSTVNGGRYVDGDSGKMIYTVSPGKAYIRGFENEIIAPKELVVDKARDSSHRIVNQVNVSPSYGQYLYVSYLTGIPDFKNRESVTFYDLASGGSVIGGAHVIAVDYVESGPTDDTTIYKLFVTDVSMNPGNIIDEVARIQMTTSAGSMRVLTKLSIIDLNGLNHVAGQVVSNATATTGGLVHKYTTNSGMLYISKYLSTPKPTVGDIITNTTTNASDRVTGTESLGKNISDNLFVQLPNTSTYSVKPLIGTDMTYKIYHEETVTTSGVNNGTNINASFNVSGMTIDPIEAGNLIIVCVAGGPLGIQSNSKASLTPDGLTMNLRSFNPGLTLKIICAATKVGPNALHKTKVLNTATETGIVPNAYVQLKQADGVRLVSVVSGTEGDITDRFSFDNGQRDYVYQRSSLFILPGATVPTGTLTVVYKYFAHYASTGDYFSIDSYTNSTLENYYESPLLSYTSSNSGRVYDLKNVLDFRPRVGQNGEYVGGTSVQSNIIQIDSRLSTSVQKYVGRIDSIVFNKDGTVSNIAGAPAENPSPPVIPLESIHLASIKVPPYTTSTKDVTVAPQKNRVYTMRDVGKLESRITNLEDYVTLTQTEATSINFDVVDASTGLSRYKSGYLVDTFNNPDIISDILNPEFSVSYMSGKIVPMFEVIEVPLDIVDSGSVRVTGGAISLPYTEVVMARQPLSSKATNINPFAVFSWVGQMVISPATDTWIDVENLASVVNNQVETRTEFVSIRRPWNWVDSSGGTSTFPPAPLPVFVD
jgi:Domain of unknown function (DUF4815)